MTALLVLHWILLLMQPCVYLGMYGSQGANTTHRATANVNLSEYPVAVFRETQHGEE